MYNSNYDVQNDGASAVWNLASTGIFIVKFVTSDNGSEISINFSWESVKMNSSPYVVYKLRYTQIGQICDGRASED